MPMLRATGVYLFVGLYVAIAAPISIVWALATGKAGHFFSLARFCMCIAGWMSGIRLQVSGREQILPGRTYLFLSNHQGNFDGPLLFYATGRDLSAVIKKEMMRIPVLSIIFRKTNFVPIDRADPMKARAGIDRAARLLKDGHSFFAFPEGTRSRDGSLGPFKKGVFVMAIKAGVPVMPVSIRNSRAIQPPGCYSITAAAVDVIFHAPIPTDRLHIEDRDKLLRWTRDAISAGLNGKGAVRTETAAASEAIPRDDR
jgi:1-acyl-sn-glycerol-3-phosphate acyltransferase